MLVCRAARWRLSRSQALRDPAIIVGIAVGPTNLDPRIGSDEASQRVHQLLYASLVRLDDQLQVVPEVAEQLEARDPTTFVAHLRDGVRFHDGSTLDAEDVAYTFRSFLDQAFLSPRKGAYAQLRSIDDRGCADGRVPPEGAVRVVPRQPRDGHRPGGYAGRGAAPASAPARTGSCGCSRTIASSSRRNADYFEGAPRNAGVVLRVIPDDTMRGLELRTGAIDLVINDLAPDIVRTLQREDRMQVVTAPGPRLRVCRDEPARPAAADVRVRRALGLAVDSAAIIEHLRRGLAVPATGIIPPMSWAHADDLRPTPYDPEEAGRLLDEAGYPDPGRRRSGAAAAPDAQDLDR